MSNEVVDSVDGEVRTFLAADSDGEENGERDATIFVARPVPKIAFRAFADAFGSMVDGMRSVTCVREGELVVPGEREDRPGGDQISKFHGTAGGTAVGTSVILVSTIGRTDGRVRALCSILTAATF